MKKKLFYLILVVITGIVGFSGMTFDGIGVVRVAFVIFADLLIVSLLATALFSNQSSQKVKLKRVRNR